MIKPMISMEMDDEAQLDSPVISAISSEKPRFPYGLRISLENAQLKAINLDPADCCIGGVIHIHGLARITSVTQNDTENGQHSRVELQIEQMCCVESEDEENEEAEENMGRLSKLYRRSGK